MSYIILKQPHPLDKIWEIAGEAVSDAHHAMDKLGDDFTDDQLNEAGEVLTEAVMALMALPARNLSDVFYKLDQAGVGNVTGMRSDCDLNALMAEGLDVLDAAVARGSKLRSVLPDLLEGVTL